MSTSRFRLVMLCLVLPITLGSAISARAEASRADAAHACTHDAFRVCSQFIPNETTTGACLRSHLSSLSSECRAVMVTSHKGRGHYRHRSHHAH